MINGYDIAYGLGLVVSAPVWLIRGSSRRKVLLALSQRMGRVELREGRGEAVLIHAVSLGEINATSALVKLLRENRPGLEVVVSTTTKTGYERGMQLYGSMAGVMVVRYPMDFTGAIDRFLNSIRPTVVVLMELELWPNFLKQCEKRGIAVGLINGRMTPTAFERYRWGRWVTAKMFRRLAAICVQDQSYAERFEKLGAPRERIAVTGTMKFDTAQVMDRVSGDAELAEEVGLGMGSERIWVCGSTGPGEEGMLLEIYRRLRGEIANLRLVIVPRKPERFDEVAGLIEAGGFGLVRRSKKIKGGAGDVVLGDTMGELRKFYSLADVVFVGRSLVDLGSRQHGSDMIEPAALGKPVAVGQWTNNFAEPMRKLKEGDGVREVLDQEGLENVIREWLRDLNRAKEMGRRAQGVVRENQGVTVMHANLILRMLSQS